MEASAVTTSRGKKVPVQFVTAAAEALNYGTGSVSDRVSSG